MIKCCRFRIYDYLCARFNPEFGNKHENIN